MCFKEEDLAWASSDCKQLVLDFKCKKHISREYFINSNNTFHDRKDGESKFHSITLTLLCIAISMSLTPHLDDLWKKGFYDVKIEAETIIRS